jgi:dihydropteroate synthase
LPAAGVLSTDCEGMARRCQIWGVLNITPDSFSDGGKYLATDAALAQARRLLAEGADVIDVGGASSRPRGRVYGLGADVVSPAQEIERVLPVIELLRQELGARISIDTRRPEVARAAIDAGAVAINDVSCAASAELLELAAERGVEYVLMHTRGTGEVEPPNTSYRDVVTEVITELLSAVDRAARHGIARHKLWIDPGLGFAKTAKQSAALLARTDELVATGLRVLCGPSRKGFIAELAPLPSGQHPAADAREPGTLAAVTAAVLLGASAVRVHDVASSLQAVLLAEAMRRQKAPPC